MLRDLTCRIVKFWSSRNLRAGLWEISRAAKTTAQLFGRLGAVFSQQWFRGFHKHKAFRLSYLSLLQSQDSLPHNMACSNQVFLYIHTVNLATDGSRAQLEEHLQTPIESN